jgi:hypothetical protein
MCVFAILAAQGTRLFRKRAISFGRVNAPSDYQNGSFMPSPWSLPAVRVREAPCHDFCGRLRCPLGSHYALQRIWHEMVLPGFVATHSLKHHGHGWKRALFEKESAIDCDTPLKAVPGSPECFLALRRDEDLNRFLDRCSRRSGERSRGQSSQIQCQADSPSANDRFGADAR